MAAVLQLDQTTKLHDLQRVHPDWLSRMPHWEEIKEIRENRVDLKKHVPQGVTEPDLWYSKRLQLTRFVSEAPAARSRAMGALFSATPDRSAVPDGLKRWSEKVDLSGQSLDAWLEVDAVPLMADYGIGWALCDRAAVPEDENAPRNRAEQLQRQAERGDRSRPFLVAYEPLQVRNWQVNQLGELLWVLILEEEWADPAEDPNEASFGKRRPVRTYRIFDQMNWYVFRTVPKKDSSDEFDSVPWNAGGDVDQTEETERIISFQTSTHGSPGMVPIARFVAEPDGKVLGQSLIDRAVELDFRRLNLESDQAWNVHMHAHPQAVLKSIKSPTELAIGANNFVHLNPGGQGQPEESYDYANLSSDSFDIRQDEIQRALVDTYRHTGTDPLGVITTTADSARAGEASGVARAWSFRTSEGRHIGRTRDRVEDGENQVWRIVGAFLGETVPDNPSNWPHDVDTETGAEALENHSLARTALRGSPTAVAISAKKTARAYLGDLSPEQEAAIDKEIDEDAAQPPPEPPPNPFGPGGEVFQPTNGEGTV